MDRNFQRALSLVLKHEGGFVDHPADPGGATNKGVTIGTFRRYVKPNGTVAELKRITDEQVATVYRRHYWDAVRGNELPDGVDYAVFDFAVNSGPNRAIKYLQGVVGTAQARNYDSGNSLASYVASTNPQWAGEAQTFVAWRDAVWSYAYAELDKVMAGEREQPSVAEFVAELPAIVWPD